MITMTLSISLRLMFLTFFGALIATFTCFLVLRWKQGRTLWAWEVLWLAIILATSAIIAIAPSIEIRPLLIIGMTALFFFMITDPGPLRTPRPQRMSWYAVIARNVLRKRGAR